MRENSSSAFRPSRPPRPSGAAAQAVVAAERFGNDERRLDRLRTFPGCGDTEHPSYVMVDTVEEDYRFETLPHGAARSAGRWSRAS